MRLAVFILLLGLVVGCGPDYLSNVEIKAEIDACKDMHGKHILVVDLLGRAIRVECQGPLQ
jgi:hypothetical protein